MFLRRLRVQKITAQEPPDASIQNSSAQDSSIQDCLIQDCPIHWIDTFAMRNFTNHAIFDDSLPLADGWMEVGTRVPLTELRDAMEDWFRRKGYLKPSEILRITESPIESILPLK